MSDSAKLHRAYKRIEAAICPGLEYSQWPYERALRRLAVDGLRWLDLGCGRRVFPAWRAEAEAWACDRPGLFVGLDPDRASLHDNATVTKRVCASASALPFGDRAFDLVTANMVFEHLAEPERQLSEVHRILDHGGRLLFHTPNRLGHPTVMARLLPYAVKRRIAKLLDGRAEEDVFPTYYRINTADTIRGMAAATGFEVESIALVCNTATTAVILPLAAFELAWIRLLQLPSLAAFRSNIITVLVRT